MTMTSQTAHDRKGGLIHWQCSHCSHEGMTAPLGVQLMFRGGQEYVFTYDNSLVTLRILLSSPAVGLFKSHDLGSDVLAVQVAEWAILMGQSTGVVRLFLEDPAFSNFFLYFYQRTEAGTPGLDLPSIGSDLPCSLEITP
jgi:hypothetical protein